MSKKDNTLLPVYFFVGEDALKRSVLEERLKTRVAATGDIDFNFAAFDGTTARAAEIIDACQTMPFLASYRYVLVRQAEGLNAASAKELCAYIAAPNPTTVLALSSAGFDGRSALAKAFAAASSASVVDCSLANVENIVRGMAVGHGATIAPAAIKELIALAGSDTIHLDDEVQKLVLAHDGDDPISVEEVRRLVAPLAAEDFKPWEFLDALCARDARTCFRIFAGVDDKDLFGLFSLCQTRLKELVAAQSRDCPTAGALAAALGKKDWQVKNHKRWAAGFPPGALEAAIVSAAHTEGAMKSGADMHAAVLTWLCDLFASCRPGGR